MLETEICNVKLQNPTVLASGFLGVDAFSLERIAKCGAGAVTSKSSSLKSREGYKNPTVLVEKSYMLNAIGLSNPGVKNEVEELKALKKKTKVPLIASVFEYSIKTFAEVASEISEAKPDLIELDLSCPHLEGKEYKQFASSKELAYEVIRAVKDAVSTIPVSAKLSPNVSDIKEIAKAVEKAEADAITVINTIGGMLISLEARKPILANKFGGVSGPAIKPVALKCVYEIYSATEGQIPIIGTGGVTNGRDALEMSLAGASAIGIGTAIYYRGIKVFKEICKEMSLLLKENGFSSFKETTGLAHK